jgi:uncharacterized protein (TIGR01244 family)
MRKLDDSIWVAPQIDPETVAQAAASGVAVIINNRPDDEEMGQPTGADIRRAAEIAGVRYIAIPVTHAGFSHAQVDAMVIALSEAQGPVLAYCRSGTRSTFLWALAKARMGDDADSIGQRASAAGYDIAPIRPMLDALSAR